MSDTDLDLAIVMLDSGRLGERASRHLEATVVGELEWRGQYDLLDVRYVARKGRIVRSRFFDAPERGRNRAITG